MPRRAELQPATEDAATNATALSGEPERDRATISPQALQKLEQESATPASAGPEAEPSETKKFVYGTLGLDRPTEQTQEPPKDGYTYGRYAAAGITVAALIALV